MKRPTDWLAPALIALACLTSGVLYSNLAAPIIGPWPSALGKPVIAFGLPIAAIATYLILRHLSRDTAEAGASDREGEAAQRAIATRVVMFIVAIHVLVLLNLSGVAWLRAYGPQAIVLLFGAFIIAVGNLLPRTRPNLAFGIRTARTLNNRQFWMQIHRTSGNVAVAFGAVLVFAAFFLREPSFELVTGASAIASIVVVAMTYWRRRNA